MAASDPGASSVKDGALSGPRSFLYAREKLWKVWWLWGIPVAWATTALVLAAEFVREAGLHAWGDLCDVLRLAIYWFWCRLAWQCSTNVNSPVWTVISRFALAGGLVATVLS